MEEKAIVVVGAGPGLGAAVGRRFAREGLVACLVRRSQKELDPLCATIASQGGRARGFALDASDEARVEALFDRIEREIGPIEVAVHNVGRLVVGPVVEMTASQYEGAWRDGCLSGFYVGRAAARRMAGRGSGTILFTGATASLRGRTGMAAFAGAKFALRALAQAMARELGPQGVHVAHVVVDGVIDTPAVRELFPDFVAKLGPQGMLNPEEIAETYWAIHCQPKSAWTHELDLRPHVESW